MVHRQIDVDEETDRHLTDLAQDYGGDLNEALADLIRSRESVEAFLDQHEEAYRALLGQQLRRSEEDFRAGNTISWAEVKRRNRL